MFKKTMEARNSAGDRISDNDSLLFVNSNTVDRVHLLEQKEGIIHPILNTPVTAYQVAIIRQYNPKPAGIFTTHDKNAAMESFNQLSKDLDLIKFGENVGVNKRLINRVTLGLSETTVAVNRMGEGKKLYSVGIFFRGLPPYIESKEVSEEEAYNKITELAKEYNLFRVTEECALNLKNIDSITTQQCMLPDPKLKGVNRTGFVIKYHQDDIETVFEYLFESLKEVNKYLIDNSTDQTVIDRKVQEFVFKSNNSIEKKQLIIKEEPLPPNAEVVSSSIITAKNLGVYTGSQYEIKTSIKDQVANQLKKK